MSVSSVTTTSSPSRPSSPPCAPNVAAQTSTPPSSPPTITRTTKATTFATQPPQQRTNAFSILGKRKAPLTDRDHNAQSQKRATAQAWMKRKDSPLTQMHLSLGQKIEKRCKECGMIYIACSAEDRELHDQYHNQLTNGYDAGGQFAVKATPVMVKERKAVSTVDDCICVVTREDPPWRRKHARNVLDIITKCLGACEISDKELWRPPSNDYGDFQMWLYMRGSICIAATLIELPQRTARRVIDPRQVQAERVDCSSAMERLRRRREVVIEQRDAPLIVADEHCMASMGISRIWTAPAFQKQGLAILMLDTMYQIWSSKSTLPARGKINEVAFSQPTAAGTKLARKWFGKQSGWLVYL